MSTETDPGGSTTLSQDEAFSVLGNETRTEILNALGAAGEPLTFTELRRQVGYSDPGNFQYHLDKLAGHFVEKSEEGYELRQAGRRVVMAVQSGAVTGSPHIDVTEIGLPCSLCQAPMELTYHEEHVRLYCTECPGHYGDDPRAVGAMPDVRRGYLGSLPIPPAAIGDRTARDVMLAAATWGHAYQLVMSAGVCPECGSTVDRDVSICEEHAAEGSLCEHCNGHHPTRIHMSCTHCIAEWNGRFDNGLLSNTDFQNFLLEHGQNLVAPETNIWAITDYTEEVLSTAPFEARYSWTIDGDTLVLTVGDDLQVVDAVVE